MGRFLQGKILGNHITNPGQTGFFMKFSDLEIGQKFFYKGMGLEKSGPLQAMESATGNEKIIMRAAAVELFDAQPSDRLNKTASLDELKQALTAYHETCLSLLQTQAEEQTEATIEAAYREVLQIVERLSQLTK
ncbi:hypothetical protein [Sedimenticola sp.]|uniref:hypothetical protein n=1 Tax=Sedimenticola sp. TaxID=1940285 RepID=UPI00259066BE|nr:hypothetical protein [Sedimenticola sp.]MCW8902587.1 hypothetical protein [Sedimenticola sp.]